MPSDNVLTFVVWNVQADRRTAERTRRIRARLAPLGADVICLAEAFPSDIPEVRSAEVIVSELSHWSAEKSGARKIVLFGRRGWTDIDRIGSSSLPEGRFVSALTESNDRKLQVLGILPPYHAYRTQSRWGERRLPVWQGNVDYWNALLYEVIPRINHPTVILGDFNIQLPPVRYPSPGSTAHLACRDALKGFRVATEGLSIDGRLLDKPPVCHIACSSDIEVVDVAALSRFDYDGVELSDHPCLVATLRL